MQVFPGSARMAADRASGLGVTFETIGFASRRASADPSTTSGTENRSPESGRLSLVVPGLLQAAASVVPPRIHASTADSSLPLASEAFANHLATGIGEAPSLCLSP